MNAIMMRKTNTKEKSKFQIFVKTRREYLISVTLSTYILSVFSQFTRPVQNNFCRELLFL